MLKQDSLVFVADEIFDFGIVKTLREKRLFGICESFPSISDPQVLQIAIDRNAVLLTEDKDFGELVHRLRMPHYGVLLVRLLKISSSEKSQRVCNVIEKLGNKLLNSFSVLNNDQLRIRPAQPK